LLRTIAGVSMDGHLYVPHVLKEVKAIGTPGTPDYKAAVTFQPLDPSRPNPKVIPIPEAIDQTVVQGMWQVVNAGGTAARIKMDGFDIAGKTGTAQVVGLGKDVGKNKDHSWFVSYAPAFKPELAMLGLIENSGFGGQHAAPAVRGVYEAYYRKTRHEEPPGTQQIAKKETPQKETTAKKKTAAVTTPGQQTAINNH
jgi:penicillin-binding protein 2